MDFVRKEGEISSNQNPETNTDNNYYIAEQESGQQNDSSPDPVLAVFDQDLADEEKANCKAMDALSDSRGGEMSGRLIIHTSCNSSPQGVASNTYLEHGAVPESSWDDQSSSERVPTKTASRQGIVPATDFDMNSFEKKPRNRVLSPEGSSGRNSDESYSSG